jgi:two-component system cell cycle sensor histidine kinase/response regulator CckA
MGRETILVVEDLETLRDLAKRLLERDGFTVLVAASAEEALTLFSQHSSIDLILTDVMLPGTSGPELIHQLAARSPTLKVIYMSGYTEDVLGSHGVTSAAFLHKPFTAISLRQTIASALGSPT